ncbi:MAG: hypothetical protein GY714_16435 [Desulfobacterales bacterium]|nr:hypothetical protein [Desulfobacterales bacterium]MCP4161982.1 hypothetical protein [Deltaproteobacteria bacterium]
MELKSVIPVLSISISSETLRINALELYNYLQCKNPFNEWIECLIDEYKGFHNFIVIKEPAIGRKDNPTLVYYISLKIAKIASLKAGSEQGEKAYDYFKKYKAAGFLNIIK